MSLSSCRCAGARGGTADPDDVAEEDTPIEGPRRRVSAHAEAQEPEVAPRAPSSVLPEGMSWVMLPDALHRAELERQRREQACRAACEQDLPAPLLLACSLLACRPPRARRRAPSLRQFRLRPRLRIRRRSSGRAFAGSTRVGDGTTVMVASLARPPRRCSAKMPRRRECRDLGARR